MPALKPTVHLGTDHAGLPLKDAVKAYLVRLGYHVHDAGAFDGAPSDYPDFIIPAAEAAASSRGTAVAIVFGGSGAGECIAANHGRGAPPPPAYDRNTARTSRQHSDAHSVCVR